MLFAALHSCSSSPAGDADAGVNPADGSTPVVGDPTPQRCMNACANEERMDMQYYCGSDRVTYSECQNLCGLIPRGVSRYQGPCGPDGMPMGEQPPYPADGVRVCDWFKNGSSWVAVECANDTAVVDNDGARVPAMNNAPVAAPADPAMNMTAVDHRARYGSVKNQGSAPTCIAFAATAGLEGAVFALSGERTPLSEMHLFSRYRSTRYGDMATAIRSGIATATQAEALGLRYDPALAARWLCTEADNCRDGVDPATPDTDVRAMLNQMALFGVSAVRRVDPARGAQAVTAEQLRERIEQGDDLIVGFRMNDNWYTRNLGAGGIISDYTASRAFGHAVLLVGYTTMNDKRYFIIRNSWGTAWADNGYGYISFETAEAQLQVAYAVAARRLNGALPDCPTGQAPAIDGTCRSLCPDGSIADAMGVCSGEGAVCPANHVADPANICVRACARGEVPGTGYTATCTPRGCVYTIDAGSLGCRAQNNGTCEQYCPAPNCGIAARMNEFGVPVISCVPADD